MNKEFIDFLKSKASIVDIVSARIRLRRSGRDWFGLCPFHKEKTGSLKVDSEKGYYYCFGCGAGGDVISFVQNFDKIGFTEAVEYLANLYGIRLPKKEKTFFDPDKAVYDALREIKDLFAKKLKEPAGKEAAEYLESRKISQESVEKFQLGFAPIGGDLVCSLGRAGFSEDVLLRTGVFNRSKYNGELVNRYGGRLIFPIINLAGKCVGFGGRILRQTDAAKYINSPETDVFVKSDHLYGYHLAARGKTGEIILTEGYLDVISMHQAGFDGAAAPLGTSVSETQIKMCWNVCSDPVVALDGDSAGVKASYRWLDKILPLIAAGKSFKFARLPEGADPSQLISEDKCEIIRDAVRDAIPLSDWMWEGAFLLYPSETPEQKVAVIKMLTDKANTIGDVSVRKLYLQILKQKERELYRRKFAPQTPKENLKPPISVRKKLEKIFIVTILNHPHITDTVMESFVRLEFEDFRMRKIKNRLLECVERRSNEGEKDHKNREAAIAILKDEMAGDIKETEMHAKFSREDATDEEAISGFFDLVEKYYSEPLMMRDLQTAVSSLKSSFSENDWQRLKALKQEVISNRIKKREV
ncbi:MAG: DNA primase [Holosporaceae bacterium]|jgi:DNA primase|nr:DNA primase [Holosporaceae bacterium]